MARIAGIDLPKNKNIVIMCRSGKRAEAVANILMTDYSISFFNSVFISIAFV